VGSYFLCFIFRCQVQDKEVVCNEKEHIISELKEKVVVLNSRIRQLEMQVKDLGHQNMRVKIFLVSTCSGSNLACSQTNTSIDLHSKPHI